MEYSEEQINEDFIEILMKSPQMKDWLLRHERERLNGPMQSYEYKLMTIGELKKLRDEHGTKV